MTNAIKGLPVVVNPDFIYWKNALPLIKEATKYFIGIHDFKAFTPNKDKRNSYVREIYEINVQEENNILTFTFRGNGFIKYQIRNMVGLLIQIGLEKKEPTDVYT